VPPPAGAWARLSETAPASEGIADVTHPDLVVVVPARNEEARVGACLASLVAQGDVLLRVMLSDNASTDATASKAMEFAPVLDLTLRTIEPLGPSAHFVSTMHWALEETQADVFALLAGDDSWSPGFVSAALDVLRKRPNVDGVFPHFVWEDGVSERSLPPADFLHGTPRARRRAALLLPDGRELSNVVYGVFRRAAFSDLADAWAKGGDDYAADYAAAWSVMGTHRIAACPAAIGHRHVRADTDLLERIGYRRADAKGPVGLITLYVKVNVASNSSIAAALRLVSGRPGRPRTWAVQALRAPLWMWGALAQVRMVLARRHGQPRGAAPSA
jgi:glycosyltransferase involved in cell wall biosynthesis